PGPAARHASGLFVCTLIMAELLPLFLNLQGRDVLLVGGGRVAAGKLQQLVAAGGRVRVVAPEVVEEIERAGVPIVRRPFATGDVDGAWLVIAAATPAVNREVAAAAEARRVFVNAVDDPANASAFLSGVVRRDGVTLAISTSGMAPGLTGLLREALDEVLPRDLAEWVDCARSQRIVWKQQGVPMAERRPLLLAALNEIYRVQPGSASPGASTASVPVPDSSAAAETSPPNHSTARQLDTARERGSSSEGRRERGGDDRARRGFVSLVEAGPGDPGLLTRRAVARLRAADLVL